MMSTGFDGDGASGVATVDWTDLAGLDQVVKAYLIQDNMIVLELADGREVRITAWLDLSTGRYVAEFEKRTTLSSAGRTLCVWAKTPAYARTIADDAQSCLEAAAIEVDRRRVF
jgi:hypothetical protein